VVAGAAAAVDDVEVEVLALSVFFFLAMVTMRPLGEGCDGSDE
jgi:hypothetical protein